MKPSKGSSVLKRKSSCTAIENVPIKQSASVAKRTRSNSSAGQKYTQRSTRSTKSQAFFELQCSTRRSLQDGEVEKSPRRRNKHLSSTLSSSSLSPETEYAVISTPLLSKRKLRKSSLKGNENSPVKAIENNSPQAKKPTNGDSHFVKLESTKVDPKVDNSLDTTILSSNGGLEDNFSITGCGPKIIVKRNSYDREDGANLTNGYSTLSECINTHAVRNVNIIGNMDTREVLSDSEDSVFKLLSSKTKLVQKTTTNGTFQMSVDSLLQPSQTFMKKCARKRYYSEDATLPSCGRRIRRLSQRGEMASVIEFVFKQQKNSSRLQTKSPNHSLPPRKKRHAGHDCNAGKHQKQKSDGDLSITVGSLESDKTFLEKTHTFSGDKSESESCLEKIFSNLPDDVVVIKNSTDTLLSATPPHSTQRDCMNETGKLNNSTFNSVDLLHCDYNNSHMDKVAIEPEESMSDFEETEENQQKSNEDVIAKWRRRTLRSSGIKCQPDYYTLGLNLMIHRHRRPKATTAEECSADESICDSEIKIEENTTEPSEDQPDSISEQSDINEMTEQYTSDIVPNFMQYPDQQSDPTVSPTSQSISMLMLSNDQQSTPDVNQQSETPVSFSHKGRGRGRYKGRGRGKGLFLRNLRTLPPTLKDPSEPSKLFDEEPPTGSDVYYFESDHVALKHNQDYHAVLRVASMLEVQRLKALEDVGKLHAKLQEVLEDPIGFVDMLQRQVTLDIPLKQNVPPLPTIDWSKYTSQFGTFDHVFSSQPTSSKPFTRQKKINFGPGSTVRSQGKASGSTSNGNAAKGIRSETFKKSWSVEEQRKLEELLVKYPQEAVEFNRFRKIAAELGGRTALQVQSRVQKYFIKLAKAGLPIPGRMPRLDRLQSCKSRHLHKHRSHPQAGLTRISTFFADYHVPVRMRDDDDEDDGETSLPTFPDEDDGGWGTIKSEQLSDEEDVPSELRYSDEYLEILRLKRKRREQLRMFDNNGNQAMAQHIGYQCDSCQCEPIRGVRYHCIDCSTADSVDLCQSCIRNENQYETATHKRNHRMEPVCASVLEPSGDAASVSPMETGSFADLDYTKIATSCGEYNYLDPNYLPPTG